MIKSQQHLEEIIRSCKRGDRKCQMELYEAYKNSLFAICLRYFKDRHKAEDMLQEGFILIYKNLDKFDSTKGTFYTWASRVVVNVILGDLRKNKIKLAYNEVLPDDQQSDYNVPIHNMSMVELVKTIQTLPDGYRMVFNMYVMEGMTHKEISEKVGISINTSKTQLMNAKKAMRQKLEKLEIYSYVK